MTVSTRRPAAPRAPPSTSRSRSPRWRSRRRSIGSTRWGWRSGATAGSVSSPVSRVPR